MWGLRAVLPWLGLIALAMVYFRAEIHDLGLWKFEFIEVMAWVGVLAAASGILWLGGIRSFPRNAGIALMALTVGDLFRVWINYYPSYPAQYLRPSSGSVAFLEQNLGENRFFGLGDSCPPRLRSSTGCRTYVASKD